MSREGTAGDLAIVLHSHMPYVEGFGTYPFGEEWLFDAVIRSYLPVLEVARDLTMTVTPVLADQLEDAGAAERLRRFLVEWRIGAAEADLPQVPEECRAACEGERRRYSRALELLDAAGGDPLAPFQRAAAEGRIALADLQRHPRRAAAAGDAGRGCGCSSTPASAPTAVASAGTAASGCPSAPTRPGSSGGWPRRACAGSASTRASTPSRWRPWRRCAPRRARWRCRSTGRRSPGSGRSTATLRPRPRPVRRQIAARDPDLAGRRRRLRPRRGRGRGAAPGAGVPRGGRAAAARLRRGPRSPRPARLRDRHRAARPLVVGGPDLAARRPRGGRGRRGSGCSTVPQALAEHEPVERPLRASTWGEGKDLQHVGLAAGRRPRLGRAADGAAPAAGRLRRACGATR